MLSMVNHQSEPNQPAQDCVENHGLQVGDLGTTHPFTIQLPYCPQIPLEPNRTFLSAQVVMVFLNALFWYQVALILPLGVAM